MAVVVVVSLDAPYCQVEISNAETLLVLSQKTAKQFNIKLGDYDLKTTDNSQLNDSSFGKLIGSNKVVDIKAKIKKMPARCARCNKEVATVLEYQRHWRLECEQSEAKVMLQSADSAISAVFRAL